jgi:hypothetical protein
MSNIKYNELLALRKKYITTNPNIIIEEEALQLYVRDQIIMLDIQNINTWPAPEIEPLVIPNFGLKRTTTIGSDPPDNIFYYI